MLNFPSRLATDPLGFAHRMAGLLGLYQGIPLTSRTMGYAGVLPDRITIYQDAIEDVCADRDEVVHEVAVTVVHEIAHRVADRLLPLGQRVDVRVDPWIRRVSLGARQPTGAGR